ncbi:MAG: helix-turn-helix domain-containing protein [bacterium]
MVSGFSTKTLKSKKSLAELFKSTRLKRELTIFDVEEATKIRSKYIEYLESGDWTNLPQAVYIRGFVLAYAKMLQLPENEIISLFETEVILNRKETNTDLSYKKSLKDVKVLITPKVLAYITFGGFALSLFAYIFFQLASFAGSPSLSVSTPLDNSIIESDSVNVNGVTESNTLLTINQEKVPVSNDGYFSLPLKLHRGVNVIKVQVVNKTKKESTKVITIEYKPKTAQSTDLLLNQR